MGRPDGPLGLFLDEYLTGPLTNHNAIAVEEPRSQFENNSQADTDLRNVRTGTETPTFSNGRFSLDTTASGTSTVGLETANLGEYSAGLKVAAGLFIRKDTDPVGLAEWGYGGDAFDDGLYWRLNSDGSYEFVKEKDSTEATVPQSDWTDDTNGVDVTDSGENVVGRVWGIDPLDGTGQSGVDVSTPVTGLFGVDMILYGGGGFAPWFIAPDRQGKIRKVYSFVFSPRNEEILDQFNQPIFGRLDNDGTAESDNLIMTERQVQTYGEANSPNRGTQHVVQEDVTISSPTAITALRRADAGGPTRVDILDVQAVFDNRAHVWFLVDPDVTTAGTWGQPVRDAAGDTAPATETAIEANDGIAVDASTGVALEGGIFQGGQGANLSVDTTSFRSSPFIRDRPVVLMAEPFGGNNPSSQDIVVNVSEGL